MAKNFQFIPKRFSGFTLVELVITIMMITVLAVVAYPRLLSFSGYAIDGYCSSAKSAIRRVQAQAMLDVTISGAYSVISDQALGQVRWSHPELTLDDSASCSGPRCSILSSITSQDQTRGIQLSSGRVQFDTLGRPIDGEQTFSINAPDGTSETIVIEEEGYVDGC